MLRGVVMITGSSRGIGLELTKQLASVSKLVLATCRSTETSPDLLMLAEQRSNVIVKKLDVCDFHLDDLMKDLASEATIVRKMEEDGKEYRWETGYEKTWEAITEDVDGSIEFSIHDMLQRAKRKRLLDKCGARIKLGMMRHLYIILDLSDAMKCQDLKPTRLICSLKLLESFLEDFFHLNPISQVGLITTRNKRAELISELVGNPRKLIERLQKLNEAAINETSSSSHGEPSLQNSVELAMQNLKHMPAYASRELLAIMGSFTTCDPGDINLTMANCKTMNIRCSVISLAAEVRVYRELAKVTGGDFGVTLDDCHFRDILNSLLEPPPSSQGAEPNLIKMGFPGGASGDVEEPRRSNSMLSYCMCHLDTSQGPKLTTAGYLCPQCQAKYCELPAECKSCGLTLVSAPHLAKSYHHLFPLAAFKELDFDSLGVASLTCFSCIQIMRSSKEHPHAYQCPECEKYFCSECDLFFHETLHSCPGCAAQPKSLGNKLNGTNGSTYHHSTK